MSTVIHLRPGVEVMQFRPMGTAPGNGDKVRVCVVAVDDAPASKKTFRELPYLVCWHQGRWCYARNHGPLYPWHEPRGWLPVTEPWPNDRHPAFQNIEAMSAQ